jgi:hypothetical protein
LLWGVASFFFFTTVSFIHQVFLAFVLMGMVSGGTSTLSPIRGAYLVFMIPALLPYGVQLLVAGSGPHLVDFDGLAQTRTQGRHDVTDRLFREQP